MPDQQNIHITPKEIEQLVIARLLVLPEGKKISIGSEGEFTKNELIDRVKQGDELGKKMIEVELDYLRSLKDITKDILADE
ncbi:hypothetical protein COS81_02625 [candidate division WWE3 bacterium CG06_land_8_20_14_3_00_42_16]|uniref:Uncharacterized protein n=1 Tax=candidate division WWE3 bacterium CG06_land_8_20_14_3_00_42_16 TaxID=1975083 RepID=A0A2M7AN39_UNCKA|nr:MAG: hypothetical protein COS81_02625 [candidate division WWE3 bacterium CG06_land_8_20_14_3_00_42_16]